MPNELVASIILTLLCLLVVVFAIVLRWRRKTPHSGIEVERTPSLLPSRATHNSGDSVNLLEILADGGSSRFAKLESMIRNGANINRAIEGATLLMFASMNGDAEAVDFLIARGASVNQSREDGTTALSLACECGHTEIARRLLGARADPDRALHDGATPLRLAVQVGQLELVRILLASGANPNAQRIEDSSTPLVSAVGKGYLDVANELIKGGANVNLPGRGGLTPLHMAAVQGDCGMTELLLKAGADSSARADGGISPADIASSCGHHEVSKILNGWML